MSGQKAARVGIIGVIFVTAVFLFSFLWNRVEQKASDSSRRDNALINPLSPESGIGSKENGNHGHGASEITSEIVFVAEIDDELLELQFGGALERSDSSQNYVDRRNAISTAPISLAYSEIEYLYRFLDHRYNQSYDITKMEFDSLKNDVLNLLYRQTEMPKNIYSHLNQMWKNKYLSIPSREYAIQFLTLFIEKEATKLGTSNSPVEVNVESILYATENPDVAGTALLGLTYLHESNSVIIDDEAILRRAKQLLRRKGNPAERASAIQVLARLQLSLFNSQARG